jgi:photosystem II stability/assembly factor-like uncharacterized protein
MWLSISLVYPILLAGGAAFQPPATGPGGVGPPASAGQVAKRAAPSREDDDPEDVSNRAGHRGATLKGDRGKPLPEAPAAASIDYAQKMARTPKGICAGIPVGPGDHNPDTLTPLHGEEEQLPGRWSWLGPWNQGGRTRAILIHPKDPAVLWAGSRGGVWKSTDGGRRWKISGRDVARYPISSLVIDPSTAGLPEDKAILYAGTGEMMGDRTPDPRSGATGTPGAGVFRSSDGGRTWRRLEGKSSGSFRFVNRLAIAPSANGQSVLLAATEQGLFRWADPENQDSKRVYPPGDGGCGLDLIINDVQFDPRDPAHAIASSLTTPFLVSMTAGKTWENGQPDLGQPDLDPYYTYVTMAFAAGSARVVYASVFVAGAADSSKASQIWRSEDGGRKYKLRIPAGYMGSSGNYYNAVWAGHPGDKDFVIVGGAELWRSTDGGNTLEQITDSEFYDRQSSSKQDPDFIHNLEEISVHTDQHCIVGHPRFGVAGEWSAFVATDGGIFYTPDLRNAGSDNHKARLWKERNDGYGTLTLNGGVGHTPTGRVLICAQDNGSYVHDPRARTGWRSVGGLDDFQAVTDDESDPDGRRFFASEQYGTVVRYTRVETGDPDNPLFENKDLFPESRNAAAFFTPVAIDKGGSRPRWLYAGALELWRTDQAFADGPDPPRARSVKCQIGNDPSQHSISAIAIHPRDRKIVWVGYANGTLAYTRDVDSANPAWNQVDTPRVFPDRYITRILLPHNETGRVYVTLGGYESRNVWVGTYQPENASSVSWTSLGMGALPNVPVRAITMHPQKPEYLYLGTETGLFVSEDSGKTWKPTDAGPCFTSVDGLFWIKNTLYAVTHGRGLYRIEIPAP